VEKFVAGMKKTIVGDPADRATQMGPMVSAEHRDSVESYIKSGIDAGASLLLGGVRPANPPLNKIFGPVSCIIKFSSEEEVIARANDSNFGLCASIWTRDTARGMRLTREIQAGSVWVNSTPSPAAEIPWGGFKESGIGKEYARVGFDDVTQMKVVGIKVA
jgi:betaine-aldehyde dehydrogenase